MEAPVAKIYSNKTKMGVEYFTNQQGIQFYTGNMMLEKYLVSTINHMEFSMECV